MMKRDAPGTRSAARRRAAAPTMRLRVYVPPRLSRAILEGVEAHVALVQAPPGYGKTSCVLQTLVDQGTPFHWHTCTPEEADPGLLVVHLVRALDLEDSDDGAAAIAAATTGIPRSLRAALAPLIAQLEADGERRLLVIDDAHHVAAGGEAAETLDYLLSRLPDTVHVMLLTRAAIDLPWLTKALVEGRALRVEADDFLMRRDEVAGCAEVAGQGQLSDTDRAKLFEVTAGWGVAIGLALRLRGSERNERWTLPPLTAVAGGDLFNYLASEVLAHLDDAKREFLRRTAVLDTLDAAVCARLTGDDGAAELIQSLVHAGLPILKVGWSAYRCHSLLRGYFLDRLSEYERRQLQALAGRAFEELARWPEALSQFIECGDYRAALDLIDAHGEELYRAGYGRALVMVVRSAPPGDVAAHDAAARWAALVASRTGEWDWATETLSNCEAAERARGDEVALRETLTILTHMLNVRGRFALARDAALRLLDLIPDDRPADRAAAALAHLVPGMTGSGDFRDAVGLIRERLPHLALEPRAAPDDEVRGRAVAAITLARTGDFAAARAQMTLAERLAPDCGDPLVRSLVPWERGLTEFLAGNLEPAETALDEAARIAAPSGDIERLLECRALRATIAATRGEIAAAEEGFQEAAALAAGAPPFWVATLTLLTRPHRLRMQGDNAAALAAAEANLALARGAGETWFACFSRIDVAYLRLAMGDVTGARDQARAAITESDQLDADLLRYGAYLMLASTGLDDEESALDEALRIADERDIRCLLPYTVSLARLDAALWRALARERHVRAATLLQARGKEGVAALERTLLRGEAALRAIDVLRAVGAAARGALRAAAAGADRAVAVAARSALQAVESAVPYGLSPRELDVLRLIVKGRRTKQIAEELVLTPSTVSTHIQHIMTKTGTASRAELVALALREIPVATA